MRSAQYWRDVYQRYFLRSLWWSTSKLWQLSLESWEALDDWDLRQLAVVCFCKRLPCRWREHFVVPLLVGGKWTRFEHGSDYWWTKYTHSSIKHSNNTGFTIIVYEWASSMIYASLLSHYSRATVLPYPRRSFNFMCLLNSMIFYVDTHWWLVIR